MENIKKMALMEPIIDCVEPTSVVSSLSHILRVDIMTVKQEDLVFTVPFQLVINRTDRCHALVAFFDIKFTCSRKSVRFSTGPRARYTHWKQTIFYFEDELIVSDGDEIKGKLSCRPNKKNPRDLDIQISYDFSGKSGHIQKTQDYFLR